MTNKKKRLKIERRELDTVTVLPEPIACQVGQAIVRWARIEDIIKKILYKLVSVGEVVGRIAIGTGHAVTQITKIEELLIVYETEIEPDLKPLKKTLDRLQKERNKLAHGSWVKNADGQICVLDIQGFWKLGERAPRIRKRLYPSAEPVTVDGIKRLVEDMDREIQRLTLLNNAARKINQSLREKPPPPSRTGNPDPGQS